MSETIGRPQLHPGVRAIVERERLRRFAEQAWRPGCAYCGEQSVRELGADDARQWFERHRDACVRVGVASVSSAAA